MTCMTGRGKIAISSSFLGKCLTAGFAVRVEVGRLANSNCTVTCTSAQASEVKYGGVINRAIIPDSLN